MDTFENDELANTQMAEQLIEAIPRIPEVAGFAVKPYTDWTGDASFSIDFFIRNETVVDQAFLHRFMEYTQLVEIAILDSDLDRFPYTHLKTAA